jgi:alpha-1,3-rhamnosyl/mannosyltransferase
VDDTTLAALYQGATALIFLSRNEGFGFPLMEAFSQGCSVIYNQACEVLNDIAEGAGIAVTDTELSGDSISTDAFEPLYDGAKREEMARRMQAVAAKYSWERCAARYIDLFARVTEAQG